MGNSAAKAFTAEPVGSGTLTGKLGKCIASECVSTSEMELGIDVTSLLHKTSEITTADGTKLYTTKGSMGLASITITVSDAQGALVCVAVGKNGFSTATFQIFRPKPAYKGQPESTQKSGDTVLYPFGKGEISKGMSTASCKYSIVKADSENDPMQVPLYEAKKLSGLGFMLAVENMEGTLVAKVAQPGMSMNKLKAETGKGVDVVAVLLIASMVGTATGSGGSAVGGLAGAGVV